MIDHNELDALERIRDAVADGIASLIRVVIIFGGFIAIWMGLLLAIVYWLTGGRFPHA